MITEPKLEHRPEQHYVAIRTAVPIPFGKYLPPLWDEVNNGLQGKGITPPGPAIIRYFTTGVLPAGLYATLLYTGPYKGKGIFKATVALLDWAKENNVVWNTSTRDNVEWWNGRTEFYLTDPDSEPDTKKYQAELAFLVK